MAVKMRMSVRVAALTAATLFCATTAHAALVISTQPTQNVACSAGVCAATTADAVLNVNDLTNMLAAGSLTVQSGSTAQDIFIEVSFSWTSSNALTLDSYRSITVDKSVSDAGPAALTLTTSDGGANGELLFRSKGRISFTSTSNVLTINSKPYTLVDSIASLASAIAQKPGGGHYALVDNYDALVDGSYQASPILEFKRGVFEGLGNSISNLTIDDTTNALVGLFGELNKATVADIGLIDVTVKSSASSGAGVGALVGYSRASIIRNAHSSGSVLASAQWSNTGGLVGGISGTRKGLMASISNSYSTASVRTSGYWTSGGLVGYGGSGSTLERSFATGAVNGNIGTFVGGLVGHASEATIENCYALGPAATGDWQGSQPPPSAGGLIGYTV